jgi:hypothetical protein
MATIELDQDAIYLAATRGRIYKVMPANVIGDDHRFAAIGIDLKIGAQVSC